jgi:Domain of unknown function DUF29
MRDQTTTLTVTGAVSASAEELSPSVSIDTDFYRWLHDQASILRRFRPSPLDWENLAEELDAMARKDRSSLRSHLQNLLSHLLKWASQSSHRSNSWKQTIDASRDHIEDLLDESPSLRNVLTELFLESKAYSRARRDAVRETGPLPYPEKLPWTLEQILDPDFLPD